MQVLTTMNAWTTNLTAVLCSVLSFGSLFWTENMSFPPQRSNLISLQSIVIFGLEGTQVKSKAWFVRPEILEFVALQMGGM